MPAEDLIRRRMIGRWKLVARSVGPHGGHGVELIIRDSPDGPVAAMISQVTGQEIPMPPVVVRGEEAAVEIRPANKVVEGPRSQLIVTLEGDGLIGRWALAAAEGELPAEIAALVFDFIKVQPNRVV